MAQGAGEHGRPPGFASLVGQEPAMTLLEAALASNHVAHAYLFVGPRGVGKHRAALALAQALLCDEKRTPPGFGCAACAACRRCSRDNHPDLHSLAPDGQQIKIDQIRVLQERLSLRAFCDGAKVAILDDADRLGGEAAAAFLKTLEEPPEATHFVLVCHNLAALSQTIVSRCQQVRFGTLSHRQVANLVEQHRQLGPEKCRLLAALSEGRPGKALGADVDRLLDMRQHALRFVPLGLSADALQCFEFSEYLARGRNRDEVLEFVEILALVVRDLLLLCGAEREGGGAATGLESFVLNLDCRDDLAQVAKCLKPEQLEAILQGVLNAAQAIRRNVNAQLTLDNLLMAVADHQAIKEYNYACHR